LLPERARKNREAVILSEAKDLGSCSQIVEPKTNRRDPSLRSEPVTFLVDFAPGRAGLDRLRKNAGDCHPEEPQATKDLRSSLILQLRRFFASLKMTAFTGFSAASEAPPFHPLSQKVTRSQDDSKG
jgi:hypothetical protein